MPRPSRLKKTLVGWDPLPGSNVQNGSRFGPGKLSPNETDGEVCASADRGASGVGPAIHGPTSTTSATATTNETAFPRLPGHQVRIAAVRRAQPASGDPRRHQG